MKLNLIFALFSIILVSVHSARIPRDDKAVSDVVNGEAESRSKLQDQAAEFSKQVSGTIAKYFNDGKQSLTTLYDKAENQFKTFRRAGGEQIKKTGEQISKVVDNFRTTLTGHKDSPKSENPISTLTN